MMPGTAARLPVAAHSFKVFPISRRRQPEAPRNTAMTYCVATMIDAGIVFASDSRTNAGVDNISTFRKMKTFERAGDRALVIINSGNLAVTQATINHLEQAIRRGVEPNLLSVYSMYDVAELVGHGAARSTPSRRPLPAGEQRRR
jgi:predicted proteasome-type protease